MASRRPQADDPWLIQALAPPSSPPDGTWILAVLAEPERPIKIELESRGFQFLSSQEQLRRMETLKAGADLIAGVDSLSAVVRSHVERVSLIEADEAYDVSHSEPRWPAQIFISCPAAAGEVSALRAAENIVHEAMHLRLTKLEGKRPLVSDLTGLLNSPWKNEPRLLQGILHGVFVFTCISEFFRKLLRFQSMRPIAERHIHRRLLEISEELATIPLENLRQGLTADGREFVQQLLSH